MQKSKRKRNDGSRATWSLTKSTIRLVGVGKVLAGTGGEVGMHRGSKQAIQK